MSKRKMINFEDNEKELLEYAMKQGNFSEYMKGLIKKDMQQPKRATARPSIYEIYAKKSPHS